MELDIKEGNTVGNRGESEMSVIRESEEMVSDRNGRLIKCYVWIIM